MSDEEIPVKIDHILAELVPKFLEHCRQMANEIHGAIEVSDFAVPRKIGHSLMGTAGSYGFMDIGLLGREIERAARETDGDRLRELAGRLDSYLARVRPVFE